MTDKKKAVKTIVLVLISIVFLFMFYNTFFKTKKNSRNTVLKKLPPKVTTIMPEKTKRPQTGADTPQVSGADSVGTADFPAQPYKPVITDIFEPADSVKFVPKKEVEEPKPIGDAIKSLVKKIVEEPALSDQEKSSISKDLHFKGSILSSKGAVAIINDEFIHVGDYVNGYKVASISEQQVFIDTGRGTIILEIMTHE